MSDEKSEQPSEKKLKKVREEGQTAKSTDLVEVASLGAVTITLAAGQHYLAESMQAIVKGAIDFTHGELSLDALFATLSGISLHAITLLCGVAVIALVAAIVALAPQTGLQISLQTVMPKFTSISPSSGIQKIISMNAVIDLLKMTIKAAVIVAVMWQTIRQSMPVVASSLNQSVPQLIGVLWSVLMHVVTIALGAFAVIGMFDYKLQQWLFVRKNRMSKDDKKRESKESEGNPEMKGERKRLARELSQQGPRRGVGQANVVVVNPVHYAVALRYDPTEFPLPVVLAKGVDEEALLLRRYATECGVPIVANPPVARMLHKIPEKQPVPEELFEVVAAILRWVDSLAAQPANPA
ncbi:EscU/YscU/HrcU family type III secretion system export apparatus switch protein [Paraburkholderia sp. SARCC-3016]|uniref:EscU/YscU/HrcU family type III secretion system export apparatus switch protein n=1 Tax=Paraburkholderia sp. SARCC-3016 TaxID=3058611 RepID=UPI002806F6B1|nr:EscU/YscU/HrcU family type III secretion system export apparatus switch protein [Paraburkholderia sp. SARCC-3016]MDQ7980266.1 EscU/YscU/HrcU family type III secretion system export apparatus switch protein [Paraburkholderia sp. SARCC-3016]